MAITDETTLPAQPASGTTVLVPLGGNGFTAPKSLFYVTVNLTGDATGGLLSIDVKRDERFEQLVDFMVIQNAGGAVVYRMDLFRDLGSRALVIGTSNADTTISTGMWSPPALIDPHSYRLSTANVDGVQVKLKMAIYNFDVRASELVPLELLLASVRRSSTLL